MRIGPSYLKDIIADLIIGGIFCAFLVRLNTTTPLDCNLMGGGL